ncbi:S41 family peptidase [Eilatimonas milleporae]|nr:S41 family peptidase [Eilatimonas milleporae]
MRCGRAMLAACLAIVVFAIAGHGSGDGAGVGESPPTGPDEWMIQPADIRADFAALYAGLQSGHADLYAHRGRAEYDALYRRMSAAFDRPRTVFDLRVAFQKFVAFGNVAHARIDFPDKAYQAFLDAGGRVFPMYPRIAAGRAYVGEDHSGHPDIAAGDEILAIDGTPMTDWLDRAAAHISADTPYIAHSLLEFSFPRYLWLELGERPRFSVSLRRDGAGAVTVSVTARTRAERQAAPASGPPAAAPEPDKRLFTLLEGGVAYLRPGPFYNAETPSAPWDNAAFTAFIDGAFEHFLAAGAQTLVIDLRDNPGGDSSFSDHMLAWVADRPFRFCSAFLIRSSDEAAASNRARLAAGPDAAGVSALFAEKYAAVPRGDMFAFDIPLIMPRDGARFTGDVHVLVNRHTYSNAVNVAAIVQDYGFGTVAGEKTTDMATTYGAMESFTLPVTGIEVGFPKAHIIRPSGDARADGVTPDRPIPSPVRPAGRDVVLDTLLAALGPGR